MNSNKPKGDKYHDDPKDNRELYSDKFTLSKGFYLMTHDRMSILFSISAVGLIFAAIWCVSAWSASEDFKRAQDNQKIIDAVKSTRGNSTIILNPDGGTILIPNGTAIITGNLTGKTASFSEFPTQLIAFLNFTN